MIFSKKMIVAFLLASSAPHRSLAMDRPGVGVGAGSGDRLDGAFADRDRDEWMMGGAAGFAGAGAGTGMGSVAGGREDRGFPGGYFDDSIDLTDITCDAELACRRPARREDGGRGGVRGDAASRNGGRRDEAIMGTYVCRSFFNPTTGEPEEPRALCIETDQAWATDVCGCCGEDCPTQPDFTNLVCDPETQPTPPDIDFDSDFDFDVDTSVEGMSRRPGLGQGVSREDLQVVCRDLYDPFTGVQSPRTVPIRSDMALADDECGCCDGVCPTPAQGEGEDDEDGRPLLFDRPELVSKSCEAEEFVSCVLPRRRGDAVATMQADEDEEAGTGFYVCRTAFNPLSGEARSEAKCISEDEAWESDECGCCGDECPDRRDRRPDPVNIECPAEEEACGLRNGGSGVFVCRSIFSPFDGALEPVSLCIPSDRAWETDTCGCCAETGCPEAPMGGFFDEDTQLMALAATAGDEEEATNAAAAATEGSGSAGPALAFGLAGALLALVGMLL